METNHHTPKSPAVTSVSGRKHHQRTLLLFSINSLQSWPWKYSHFLPAYVQVKSILIVYPLIPVPVPKGFSLDPSNPRPSEGLKENLLYNTPLTLSPLKDLKETHYTL